jgi:hypothetical protein
MAGKSKWAAAAALTTALTLTAASAGAAPASAGSGWQIAHVFQGQDYLDPQAIAASGSDNAWLTGLVPNPEPSFAAEHWNGRRWASVALPAGLSGVLGPWCLYSGVYTTSPSDTWFFPVLPRHQQPVQYALRWTGSRWRTSVVTTSADTVLDAAVFGPSDVWTFGEAGYSFLPIGPAVVRRWNGHQWRTVPMPLGTPTYVEGVSPSDIWALGVSKDSLHGQQNLIPMHWNGVRWSSPALPVFKPVKHGYPWVPTALSATSHGVWVAESPAVNEKSGESPAGVILLHWTGSGWGVTARSAHVADVTSLASDGHGGFWLASIFGGGIGHYRDGRITSQAAPGKDGYAAAVAGGPGSAWAIGGDSSGRYILRYAGRADARPVRLGGHAGSRLTAGRPGDGWPPRYSYNCAA